MTNAISNNYSLGNLANTVTSKVMAGTQANSASGTTNGMSANNIGSTFLSLLTQELQNQDPTAPMDSTAMVGQMISLNSLSQLISINQTLGGVAGSSSSSKSSATQQQMDATVQQSPSTTAKDTAAAAIQAAASATNPLSYLFPMNQLAGQGASGANVGAAQSALLSFPSAIR